MKRSFIPAIACFLLAVVASATELPADQQLVDRERQLTTLKQAAAATPNTPGGLQPLAGCTPTPISSPVTINGFISTSSCYDAVINGYADIYNLSGIAGQTVTIDYSSTAYETFLWMEGVPTELVSFLSSGVSRRRIVYTFPTTRTYKLELETLYGPGDGQPYTGAYTLNITNGGCATNATTMCLSNDRFAVSATYSTGTASGNASAKELTSDSGYLTFFSASNIEVVVKVLDGCGLNSRFWVYAGGLTNVNTVITIRDTKTGAVKTYTNPQGTPFQPIQDTSAMAVCP